MEYSYADGMPDYGYALCWDTDVHEGFGSEDAGVGGLYVAAIQRTLLIGLD